MDREKLKVDIGKVIADLKYEMEKEDERRMYVPTSKDAQAFEHMAFHALRQAQFFLDLAEGAEQRHRRENPD